MLLIQRTHLTAWNIINQAASWIQSTVEQTATVSCVHGSVECRRWLVARVQVEESAWNEMKPGVSDLRIKHHKADLVFSSRKHKCLTINCGESASWLLGAACFRENPCLIVIECWRYWCIMNDSYERVIDLDQPPPDSCKSRWSQERITEIYSPLILVCKSRSFPQIIQDKSRNRPDLVSVSGKISTLLRISDTYRSKVQPILITQLFYPNQCSESYIIPIWVLIRQLVPWGDGETKNIAASLPPSKPDRTIHVLSVCNKCAIMD